MMMRNGILATASFLIIALAAGPSMARQPRPVPQPAMSTYCATIEPGNPFSKVYDYEAWSAWRARGLWDDRGSNACARNPLYSPGGTSPYKRDPYPNPSWF